MLKQISNRVVCGIYKIISPIGRVYIGQSINIYKRIANYRCGHCKNQIYLHRSILKYGWEAHQFSIIHECDQSELNNMEEYYVDLYQSLSTQNGLNIKGGGGSKGKMSDETKRKIGIKSKGRKFSEEVLKKIGLDSSMRKLSDDHKKKFTFQGKTHSDEWRRKAAIRNSGENNNRYGVRFFGKENWRYGTKHTYKTIELKSKIVLNTETGIFYTGVKEAAFSIGVKYYILRSRLGGAVKNKTPFIYA